MKHKWLITLLIVAVLGELGFGYVRSHRSAFGVCGVNPTDHAGLITSHVGSRKVKVLFVGNSRTFVNDLPGMLVKVADSDPNSRIRLVVGSNTNPGARLKETLDDGCALKRIRAEHFDHVVLQEWGVFWSKPLDELEAREVLGPWASDIRATGAVPEYFEPWVDRPANNPYYSDLRQVEFATHANADQYGVPIVPVGEAFAEATNTPGAPDLYMSDLYHPSAAGTYLAALIFFHRFTGERAERATWRPDGVSPVQAALLAHLADKYS